MIMIITPHLDAWGCKLLPEQCSNTWQDTGGPSSRCEELLFKKNLYANVQLVKPAIVTLLPPSSTILLNNERPYAKRDSGLSACGGVMLQQFEFKKVCMGENVKRHFSRNFDIFSIKMTYLNALLSFYCPVAFQCDPKPFKRVIPFRVSSPEKEY